MRNPFQSSHARLRWAKKDILYFERNAKRFLQRVPHTQFIEPDANSPYDFHKLRFLKSLPESLTNRAVSAAENLRSSLDLASVAVGRLCRVSDTTRIHFPFCKTADNMKSRLNSACKNLPEEIRTLFAGFKPYKGGNDFLWAINEAANTSKHDLIAPLNTAASVRIKHLQGWSGGSGGRFYFKPTVMTGPNNEITFAVTERGLKYKYDIEVAVGVIFGHVDVIGGREVFPTLSEMVRIVSFILADIERKCRDLGLM